MATLQLSQVLQHLRRIHLLDEERQLDDGELLGRFFQHGDQTAFEVLVERYGSMVFGVCQRLLRNAHDSEDAFQVVFLVLVHKGQSLSGRGTIGNWLYGVAYHTALKARAASVQRRSKESKTPVKSAVEPANGDGWEELRPLIDQELNKLPDKLREAIVLCDVLDKPLREAAKQLNVPLGTLSGRLTTGRRRLADRLKKVGVTLSAGAVAILITQGAAATCVPAPLIVSTIKAATTVAAGSATAGVVSASVVALSEGVVQAMFMTKKKTLSAVVLAFFLIVGVVFVGHGLAATSLAQGKQEPKDQKDQAPAKGEKKDEPIIKTLVVAGSGKVTIRQSGKETVGGAAVQVGDVKGGVLELKNSKDVVVEVKEFPALVHAGSGCVIGEDIKTKQAVVSMVMGASGEVRLSGSADNQSFVHEGSGQIDGRNLKGKTAVVNVLKTGEVTVNVTDSLVANIADSGSVRYLGSPVVTKNVLGTGSVAPTK